MKKVIVTNDGFNIEVWSHFRKLCTARGWSYRYLANKKRTPRIGEGVPIKGQWVERKEVL